MDNTTRVQLLKDRLEKVRNCGQPLGEGMTHDMAGRRVHPPSRDDAADYLRALQVWADVTGEPVRLPGGVWYAQSWQW